MPLYEFQCDGCGVFDLWRSMSESSNPAHCPGCNERGKRIFSPPMTLSSKGSLKRVSAEPELVKRDLEPKQPRVQYHAGSRPWMVGH
jgi:putative FmdB family regulatory protein